MKRFLSILLVISVFMSFAACGGGKTYTVTFHSNGGSPVASQTVKAGEKASEPSAPTKGEMYFAGWFSDSDLTVPYDFAAPVNGDITLYAKWTRFEGSVSASGTAVDSYFITDLEIDRDSLAVSAKVSAPAGCKLLVRFISEDVYFSENYPENKQYISENSLYASCDVKAGADTEAVVAYIQGSLPEYYVAEAILIDARENALSNPVSFIRHTQRYDAFADTTINDFADSDTVLQFGEAEDQNFGVLSDNVIVVNVRDLQMEDNTYRFTGADKTLRAGDKVLLTDGENVALLQVDKVASSGDVTEVNARTQSGSNADTLSDYYKFIKFDMDMVASAQADGATMQNQNGVMLLGKVSRGIQRANKTKVIRLNLEDIRLDTDDYIVDGRIDGKIQASLVLEAAPHILGRDYFRFDFVYTIDGDAYLAINDKPTGDVDRTEKEILLGRVELPFGIPGLQAFAEINAQLDWEADGGLELSGRFHNTQGFRFNTKDGYQVIDQKSSNWTLSCEAYAVVEFGPNPVIGLEWLRGVVSCQLDSFMGVRTEVTIEEPADGQHLCYRCADGALYGVVSTDAELEYKLASGHSGRPIDKNLVYSQEFLCDFYISLSNHPDSIFGNKVKFGMGQCPNRISDVVATEPTTEPTTEPPVTLPHSEGLAFKLNSDAASYTVTGIGSCTDYTVVIPSKYNGLPVTAIGYKAFYNCSSLYKIIIPDSIKIIDSAAFHDCVHLSEVVLPRGITKINASTFSDCYSLNSITIPDTVTQIDNYAFYDCTGLKSITIPNAVTSIGDFAFSGCNSLTEIVLSKSLKQIGRDAFRYCSKLVNITLPESLTDIGDGAFNGCSSLVSIELPSGITSVEGGLFVNCSALTSILIPDGVTAIGNSAFQGCSSLVKIAIPDTVISIGDDAFKNCTALTSISLPDSIESLGDVTFSGCSSLKNITIPYGLTCLGGRIFENCSALTTVTLPNTLTDIGYGAFFGCSKLSKIAIPDSVKSIDDRCFYQCRSLESITIASGVTSIKGETFYECSGLKSVKIPNTVKSIEYRAFADCSSLTEIVIPDGVTDIADSTFARCTSLTNVVIPSSVETIGNGAFKFCFALKSVHISSNVTSIGEYAFEGCRALTDITLPDGLVSIGTNAFDGCRALTSIVIPDRLTNIPAFAFRNCESLTSITIPGSVTSIGRIAFALCPSLNSIRFEGTVAQWNRISMGSDWNINSGDFTIYCTDGEITKDGTVTYK